MQKPDRGSNGFFRQPSRHPLCAPQPDISLAALRLVSPHEMDTLRHALRMGTPPLDLSAKLDRLRTDDHKEYYLKQTSSLLIDLLKAAAAHEFCEVTPEDCERLLRMLAYVRKDDDAIPDSRHDGFGDDHDLMRRVCGSLQPLLETYKAWHLARRVPLLWHVSRIATPNLGLASG